MSCTEQGTTRNDEGANFFVRILKFFLVQRVEFFFNDPFFSFPSTITHLMFMPSIKHLFIGRNGMLSMNRWSKIAVIGLCFEGLVSQFYILGCRMLHMIECATPT